MAGVATDVDNILNNILEVIGNISTSGGQDKVEGWKDGLH